MKLAKRAKVASFSRNAILEALSDERQIDIRIENGSRPNNLLSQYRQDGHDRWLFIAHAFKPKNPDKTERHTMTLRIRGEFEACQYDAMDGRIKPVDHTHRDGETVVKFVMDGVRQPASAPAPKPWNSPPRRWQTRPCRTASA